MQRVRSGHHAKAGVGRIANRANRQALYKIAKSRGCRKICATHGIEVGFSHWQLCVTLSLQAGVRLLATVRKVLLFFLVEDFLMVQNFKMSIPDNSTSRNKANQIMVGIILLLQKYIRSIG
jgi:hypothetical protein